MILLQSTFFLLVVSDITSLDHTKDLFCLRQCRLLCYLARPPSSQEARITFFIDVPSLRNSHKKSNDITAKWNQAFASQWRQLSSTDMTRFLRPLRSNTDRVTNPELMTRTTKFFLWPCSRSFRSSIRIDSHGSFFGRRHGPCWHVRIVVEKSMIIGKYQTFGFRH